MQKAEKQDRLATGLILGLAGIAALIVISLVAYLLITGLPHVSWHFLTSSASSFTSGGGIFDQLFNSFYLVILTLAVAVPLAFGTMIGVSLLTRRSVPASVDAVLARLHLPGALRDRP